MTSSRQSRVDLPAGEVSPALAAVHRALDTGAYDALDALGEALVADATGDEARVGDVVRAHAALSVGCYRRNQVERAARHAAAAREVGRLSGRDALRAEGLVAWGRVLWRAGDLDDATRALEEALPLAAAHGDPRLGVHANNLLGLVHADLGRLESSLAMHERAMEFATASGSPDLELVVVSNLAGRWFALGERADEAGERDEALAAWGRAVDMYEVARALCADHHLEHGSPHVLATHGATLFRLGRGDEALAVFRRQREIAGRTHDWSSLGYAARYLALLHRGRGNLAAARAALAEGISAMEAIGGRARLAELHEQAAALEESAGRFAEALAHHKAFHALHVACAVERAELRARLLAVRLDTERALAEARAERGRAAALQEANASLARRAEAERRAARTDALTNIANRRHLDDELPRLFERARAAREPLAVALVDADHFKRVNDDFSHAAGDAVLRRVAALLAGALGPGALCARYGGEEFALALPGADAARALAEVERARAAVERFDWASIAPGLRVTVSAGVADAVLAPDAAAALARADEALYRAKRTGRNRVCLAGGSRVSVPRV